MQELIGTPKVYGLVQEALTAAGETVGAESCFAFIPATDEERKAWEQEVVVGVVGLALSRNKEDEADPVALPEDAPWRGLRSDSPPGSNTRLREQPQSPTEDNPQQ